MATAPIAKPSHEHDAPAPKSAPEHDPKQFPVRSTEHDEEVVPVGVAQLHESEKYEANRAKQAQEEAKKAEAPAKRPEK